MTKSLVVAIEPDRDHGARLSSIVLGRLGAELVLAESAARALATLGDRIPDLILTPALLSTRDEAALAGRLRELGAAAAHVQTVTLPRIGGASVTKKSSRGMLDRFRKPKPAPSADEGCDPEVFAQQVSTYLQRAQAERASAIVAAAEQTPAATPVVDQAPFNLDDLTLISFVERKRVPTPEPSPIPAVDQRLVTPSTDEIVTAAPVFESIDPEPSAVWSEPEMFHQPVFTVTENQPYSMSEPVADTADALVARPQVFADIVARPLVVEAVTEPVAEALAARAVDVETFITTPPVVEDRAEPIVLSEAMVEAAPADEERVAPVAVADQFIESPAIAAEFIESPVIAATLVDSPMVAATFVEPAAEMLPDAIEPVVIVEPLVEPVRAAAALVEPVTIDEDAIAPSIVAESLAQPALRVEQIAEPTLAVEDFPEPLAVVEEFVGPSLVAEEFVEPPVLVEQIVESMLVVEDFPEPAAVVEACVGPSLVAEALVEPTVLVEQIVEPTLIIENIPEPTAVVEAFGGPSLVAEDFAEPTVLVERIVEPTLIIENIPEPTAVVEAFVGPSLVAEEFVEPPVLVEQIVEPMLVVEDFPQPAAVVEEPIEPAATVLEEVIEPAAIVLEEAVEPRPVEAPLAAAASSRPAFSVEDIELEFWISDEPAAAPVTVSAPPDDDRIDIAAQDFNEIDMSSFLDGLALSHVTPLPMPATAPAAAPAAIAPPVAARPAAAPIAAAPTAAAPIAAEPAAPTASRRTGPRRHVPVHEQPAPKPKAKAKPARRKGNAPAQDEWGLFDPDQCGFAALVAKLDAVTEDEDVQKRPGTSARVISCS